MANIQRRQVATQSHRRRPQRMPKPKATVRATAGMG